MATQMKRCIRSFSYNIKSHKHWNRSSRPKVFCKKGVLENFAKFTWKHPCQSLSFNKVAFIKKETLAQVFSCEFCEISKNTVSYRTPPVAASVKKDYYWKLSQTEKFVINVRVAREHEPLRSIHRSAIRLLPLNLDVSW